MDCLVSADRCVQDVALDTSILDLLGAVDRDQWVSEKLELEVIPVSGRVLVNLFYFLQDSQDRCDRVVVHCHRNSLRTPGAEEMPIGKLSWFATSWIARIGVLGVQGWGRGRICRLRGCCVCSGTIG